ncbi:hypothetical protein CY34DRAFT_801190 [Suillus luteus UH-Slu-Lm8-n1]|uniref:Uncharacterized protein n=1 Tax=Suillus luteus UH-Slu-Lm8-n1 TaxID=930992 RepID=A0A0D0B7C1_9AGAM|nr:hypothetical protein CY34DRAFT_801190 [Suillus luteus UH-Slu-Lm8-n1]
MPAWNDIDIDIPRDLDLDLCRYSTGRKRPRLGLRIVWVHRREDHDGCLSPPPKCISVVVRNYRLFDWFIDAIGHPCGKGVRL